MEVGRLPNLFAGKSGYIHKMSLQGDGGVAMVHTSGANPEYSLISFRCLSKKNRHFLVPTPPPTHPTPSHTHVCVKPLTLCVTFLLSSMIHINFPPSHPHCTTYREFCVISLSIHYLSFSLVTYYFFMWDQFLEGNGI